MRILFTFVGGNGHFEPLLPIARAATAAGHTVAVAGRRALVPAIEAAGFVAFGTGAPASGPPKRMPLLPVDMAREDRDLRNGFADRLARQRAAEIGALCGSWQPDVLVCDEIDFGCMLAAERLGLPYASVLVIAAGSFVRPEVVGEPLGRLRAELGLPPDPELAMLSRYLVLSPFPRSYRDPRFALPATAQLFHAPPRAAAPPLPWRGAPSDAPLVYFSLGTVFNLECGDLFTRVFAGLRELPIRALATVGRDIDPAEFGPQPAHIQIERFVPQADILPHCRAVISHGGSGGVLGALSHGLPMLLLPMGADQPLNAARCADLGIARSLDVISMTSEQVRDAVAELLASPSYRQAAGRLRDEIAAMPAPEHALALLERLAHERQPIIVS